MFFKLAGAGKERVPFFLIVLSLKLLNFIFLLIFIIFFTKYHFSSHFFPYSTGVAHPQAGLGSVWELGDWSEKVQDGRRGGEQV
jgi:hypothetical protein